MITDEELDKLGLAAANAACDAFRLAAEARLRAEHHAEELEAVKKAAGAFVLAERAEYAQRHAEELKAARREGGMFVLGVLLALVSSLPACDLCKKPATRAWVRGSGRWCDDHRFGGSLDRNDPEEAPDYPRANPIRAALALLEAEGISL